MALPPGQVITLEQIAPMRDTLRAVRGSLHAHPELSGDEAWTADFIAGRLVSLGLEVESGVGGHGVVGLLCGGRPGPTIAYRADIDGLPIQEATGSPYRSLILGVSHACGHDAHVTLALGVAEVLAKIRQDLPGTVKLIFQPAEESLVGARAMIDDGVLANPKPEAIVALHTFPLPTGTVGLTPGLCLAGMEEFRVRFYAPSGNRDRLVARAIEALEALSTDKAPTTTGAFDAVVRKMLAPQNLRTTIFLSCWPHSAGHAPPYHLMGLVSITDFARREAVRARIRETLDRVAGSMGATYDLVTTFANPPLRNDPDLVQRISPVVEQVVGPAHALTFRSPYPFAHEDFALFAKRLPAALLWLGTANRERGIDSLLHTPDYDIDEDALVTGVSVAASTVRYLLSRV
jgi:amidohydrolase